MTEVMYPKVDDATFDVDTSPLSAERKLAILSVAACAVGAIGLSYFLPQIDVEMQYYRSTDATRYINVDGFDIQRDAISVLDESAQQIDFTAALPGACEVPVTATLVMDDEDRVRDVSAYTINDYGMEGVVYFENQAELAAYGAENQQAICA
ncbi:hypothetical protein KA047_01745 [Candidatus Saccharibacteria bacterium]|nr:hypothetical protein [Candidatus Saccharibacteria bacterium]